jgi:hypothetical protein
VALGLSHSPLGKRFFWGSTTTFAEAKRSICRPSKKKVPCQGISLTSMALDVQRNFEMFKDDLTILNDLNCMFYDLSLACAFFLFLT